MSSSNYAQLKSQLLQVAVLEGCASEIRGEFDIKEVREEARRIATKRATKRAAK
jgi:hypothetical protein